MYAKIASALALAAVVSQVAAVQPVFVRMESPSLYGVFRRDDSPYQPTQAVCNMTGNTCSEVCGSGYATCLSTDDAIHCFNQAIGQSCCGDNSGNSCDPGFECAVGPAGQTYCCQAGQDLAACAASNGVASVSFVTTRPAETTTSSAYPTTTAVNTTTAYPTNTTTSVETSTSCTSTITESASYPASNATTGANIQTTTVSASGTPTKTNVSINGAAVAAPAGTLLLVAAAFAALL